MADEKNTGPSLRDMAYRAAGGGRESNNNALVDAANKVFETYADQMAIAAAQRRALRQDAKEAGLSVKEMKKNKEELDKQLEGFDPNKKNTTSEEAQDTITSGMYPSDAEVNVDNDPSMNYQLNTQPLFNVNATSSAKMRSPIKQSLFGAAKAAAGSSRKDTKNISKFIDDLAGAAIEARRTTQRVLRDKVVKELEDFSPEVVDLEGFNGFMNGKNAVTNFGIDLKQKIAEKRDAALKLNPYSMKYKETMAEINSLVESTKNLNLEQTRLKNLKKEWGNSSAESLYSKGSSKTTMHYLNQVMSKTAGMELDENGQVVFNVATLDDPTQTTQVRFDDLNKNLFLKVDESSTIADYHRRIYKDIIDKKEFNKGEAQSFWNTLIAPDDEDALNDGELLSWIHDKPYNIYTKNSFYDEFKSYFLNKELAITSDGEPLVMTQEAIDILFDPDTKDWDATTQDGKTVREYIREELINYYARTSEQYYYYTSRKQDPTSNTIGNAINEVKLP
mgnify:CR=1 FL=1